MIQKLIQIRYLYIIAVVFILLNSIYFLAQGVVKSIHGYALAIEHGVIPSPEIKPGMSLLEGLDAFMVSFVFLIFGLGVARLFIFHESDDKNYPAWLNVHDFKELKILLWETILVALVIYALGNFIDTPPSTWQGLVQPAFILILTIALFFMRKEGKKI